MNALTKMWSNTDLRKRILFTLAIFVIYRMGTFITVPGVNVDVLYGIVAGGVFGIMDIFSGGALAQFSIFAMSIGPYITASIVIQLLQMDVVPILAEWAQEGETGKRKLNRLTRYMSLGLAFIQGITMAIGFNFMAGGALLQTQAFWIYIYIGLIMTAGTAILLFLGDQITAKGIGNGVSMLIVAGILSRMPDMFRDLYLRFLTPFNAVDLIAYITVIALFIVTIIGIIYLQSATRKLPIQYANRHNAGQLTGQKDSFIPFKLNSAGVIPVIFASSISSIFITIAQFFPENNFVQLLNTIFNFQTSIIGLILYMVLIGVFTYFYAFVQVSPEKIAENLKKQGSYIPGIRPGDDTENYVAKILGRVTFLGAISLIVIATLPIILGFFLNLPPSVQIGGTGILIVVGVAMETAKEIANKNQEKEYRGFIK